MHAYSVRFHVTEEQRKEIQGRIERDAQWMSDHGLMDYSLVVGIAEQKEGRPFPAGSDDQQPYVSRVRGPDGKAHTIAYYIGIIDFLQEWTATKCATPPSLPGTFCTALCILAPSAHTTTRSRGRPSSSTRYGTLSSALVTATTRQPSFDA